MAYDFVHSNMPEALPSLRTVQRTVTRSYKSLYEGEFQYDALVAHLKAYDAPMVVTVGEDATRVISRVEYDNETNCLVGFVLPNDANGLPEYKRFTADSFEAIEEAFRNGKVSKYAFVYMAQPLKEGVPAFCLTCLGTDNKFSAELVLKRWNYIIMHNVKRGASVFSLLGQMETPEN